MMIDSAENCKEKEFSFLVCLFLASYCYKNREERSKLSLSHIAGVFFFCLM